MSHGDPGGLQLGRFFSRFLPVVLRTSVDGRTPVLRTRWDRSLRALRITETVKATSKHRFHPGCKFESSEFSLFFSLSRTFEAASPSIGRDVSVFNPAAATAGSPERPAYDEAWPVGSRPGHGVLAHPPESPVCLLHPLISINPRRQICPVWTNVESCTHGCVPPAAQQII